MENESIHNHVHDPEPIDLESIGAHIDNDHLIRVHESEYNGIPKTGRYVHVNIGKADNHRVGEYYAFPRIIGRQDSGKPIMSFKHVLIARCDDVHLGHHIDDLSGEDFNYMMGHIRDSDSLKKILLDRYTISRPDLSTEGILESDLTITYLEILGEVERIDLE